MANITAALVKELREKTGAGMMDCKNALSETDGDIEAGVDSLQLELVAEAAVPGAVAGSQRNCGDGDHRHRPHDGKRQLA